MSDDVDIGREVVTIWWTEREPREARIRDALARGERHQRTDPTSMVIATLPLIDLRHLVAERDALRAQRDSLRDALEKALEWIEGWDPGFTMEPDWPADHAAMRGVLATLRDAGHE